MASRKEQKDAARQRRLAEEQATALKARRTRRLQMVGGTIAAAIVIVVVLVIVSTSGGGHKAKAVDPHSAQASATQKTVSALLANIPQHGNVLGNPKAPVTMIEYGDLVCPVCQEFAVGSEQQLISNEVRQGKVKIEYRAFETASAQANNAMFVPGQAAALAAGEQNKEWNYILTWYHEQQSEDDPYVTDAFLQGLADQIPGLNVAKWSSDRSAASLKTQVNAAGNEAQSVPLSSGVQRGTPLVVFQGPVSQSQAVVGDVGYSSLSSAIKSVA